jgi:hypothetical protein
MSDPDTGDFDGLPPQEALDTDERLDGDDDSVDPPDSWHGADRFGTTHAEEVAGAPLSERLAEELPDDAPADLPDRPVSDTPIDDLDESVDRRYGLEEELTDLVSPPPE